MVKNPVVSIIMPVYNAENYLKETMDSILYQTFKDFELLIVDDFSTDNSYQILMNYQDPRIKIFKNEKNIGYVKTLNNLIKLTSGLYVARHDNDDISNLTRLEKQVDFLNKNQDIGICGSNALTFGNKENMTLLPLKDKEIRAYMIFGNPFYHSTVMFRKNLFENTDDELYDESYCPAEDYALWFSISKKTKLANISDTLLNYRLHENNTSSLKKTVQIENANRIRKKIFKNTLSMNISEKELLLLSLGSNRNLINYSNLISFENLLIKILNKNLENKYFEQRVLKNLLFYLWTNVCFKLKNISFIKKINIYIFSPLYDSYSLFSFISIRNIKKLFHEFSKIK